VESPGPLCWHGLHGCIETWLSGPGLAADHARVSGEQLPVETIVSRPNPAKPGAATLARYKEPPGPRPGPRHQPVDPEIIVSAAASRGCGGLYRQVPALWAPWVFFRPRHHHPAAGPCMATAAASWAPPGCPCHTPETVLKPPENGCNTGRVAVWGSVKIGEGLDGHRIIGDIHDSTKAILI